MFCSLLCFYFPDRPWGWIGAAEVECDQEAKKEEKKEDEEQDFVMNKQKQESFCHQHSS